MKNLRILAAATLFALTSIAMLSGCGPLEGNGAEKDGQECTSATSCGDGYVCAEWDPKAKKGKCRVDCANAAGDAGDSSKCSVVAGSTCKSTTAELEKEDGTKTTVNKYYCAPPATANPNACKEDGTCEDATKVCDTSQNVCVKKCTATNGVCAEVLEQCNVGTSLCENTPLRFLVITDMSKDGDAACKGGNKADAGADIVGVSVTSVDGTTINWGAVAGNTYTGVVPASAPNYDPSQPDGNAPTLGSDSCPIDGLGGNHGKFTSIGCGGHLGLEFTQPFYKGATVKVYEYDKNICKNVTDGAPDIYQVWACKTLPADLSVDMSSVDSCVKISTGDLTGFGELKVNVE